MVEQELCKFMVGSSNLSEGSIFYQKGIYMQNYNIATTTKMCTMIIADYNEHMKRSIPEVQEQFPEMDDKEILYLLLQKSMEIFEQNDCLWN